MLGRAVNEWRRLVGRRYRDGSVRRQGIPMEQTLLSTSSAATAATATAATAATATKAAATATSTTTATTVSKSFIDRYGDHLSVSSEVMETVITEALQRKDSKTLQLLISQSNKVGTLSIHVLEESVAKCLKTGDMENATVIVQSCGLLTAVGKGSLSQSVCEDLLSMLVNHCRWKNAAIVMEYMIRCDIACTSGDREVFHIIGGLLKDTEGVIRALQLMTTITEKRRTDLAMLVNFKKANRFAMTMGGSRAAPRSLPRESLEHFAIASFNTLKEHGWYSFTLSKMLVALTCGSGNHDLAVDYITKTVEHLSDSNKTNLRAKGTARPTVDVLSALRGFSQGAGVASNNDTCYKGTWVQSPVSKAILDLAVIHLERGSFNLTGPLKTTEFLQMYWVLCYRAGRANLSVSPAGGAATALTSQYLLQAQQLQKPDHLLKSSYDELVAFMTQNETKSMISRPSPGYHRRAFRILCDELGLRHKLGKFEESRNDVVRVWKESGGGSSSTPPTLHDLLLADSRRGNAMRRFDGVPPHWPAVVKQLRRQLSPEALQALVLPTAIGSLVGFPSSEWGLLMLEALHGGGKGEREAEAAAEAPTSLLRPLLKMCSERSDVYGLLEVLHLSADQTNSTHNQPLRNKERAPSSGGGGGDSGIDTSTDSKHPITSTNDRFFRDDASGVLPLGLRPSDWNLACNVAYHARLANIPAASFDAAFAEVVRLMREANVEFEDGTMRTLLRYLVYSQPESELTSRILKRLHRDKSVKLCHIECAALSLLMLQRISSVYDTHKIVLTKPLYKAEAYLLLYPEGFSHLMDVVVKHSDFFGDDFLAKFEAAWAKIHSQQGRQGLYELLSRAMSVESAGGGRGGGGGSLWLGVRRKERQRRSQRYA